MADPVTFKLRGAPLPSGRWPRIFQDGARAAAAPDDDPFLPPGFITLKQSLDLSASARSTVAGSVQRELTFAPGDVLVLELPEGVTVITHPSTLRDAVQRIDAQALDADGALALDRALRTRGQAMRGSAGDAMAQGLNSIVSRMYSLTVGETPDALVDAARRKACEWLGDSASDAVERYADLGVSWLGTKALMWAIESRLKREPGLYRCSGSGLGERFDAGDARLRAAAAAGPLLVLIHGSGSSTHGSFEALRSASGGDWKALEDRYGERVLALEHRSLSESPIDNALQLARALPAGATVHLLTHSRGGLVGDLLCLQDFDELIDDYAADGAQWGVDDPAQQERLRAELRQAHAEQRSALHELAAELGAKQLRIERYVRVAAPVRGTRLASGNLDVFLSALLSLMAWVPALMGSPVYSAFKRVVLEIARHRTHPHLVPGIEAMLPGSPLARLLARAAVQPSVQLGVISGDVQGGGWLKRLGSLFTDFIFFDSVDNDFVVDTDSMSAGVARPGIARVLFDQGPQVGHFRYFVNDATRLAARRWLTEPALDELDAFKPIRAVDATLPDAPAVRAPGAAAATPVTVLLPGIMGSHLWRHRRERVWFDLASLALGGLAKLQMKPGAKKDAVEAETVFAHSYGSLVAYLRCTHRVVPFAYDWRQPLDVLADRLARALRQQLDATRSSLQPVRVLAHSMGGLVVRALVHRHAPLWDELMARGGARLVMLGTPHQGSHRMVETLIGKSDAIRKLGLLDVTHGLQEVIDIVAGFPGALQLLPKPGFVDTGNDTSTDYFDAALWGSFKKDMRDLWFGNGIGALPSPRVLQQAQWLWAQDRLARPSLPARHEAKVAYVFGCAPQTACGVTREAGRWKMLGTPLGDGAVTWESGRIDGIGHYFYLPAHHGALADSEDYFESIAGLLDHGDGGQLMTTPPAVRGADEAPVAASYDAGPTPYPTDSDLAGGLLGGGKRTGSRPRRQELLAVRVKAMDLRQVTQPILVGHYEQDAISGPEAIIDRDVVHGELSLRHHLGLYAGPIGSASAVILHSSAQERQRGSMRGAVVTGLGPYDGSLTVGKLTEAVRAAGLRYLLHALDSGAVAAGSERAEGLRLASLLLGYNSSANLSIADSVQALMRGVVEANRHFADTTGSKLRIGVLEIVEVYLDSAITATYDARHIAQTMNADKRVACRIEADPLLHQGEGMRQRLYDAHGGWYWPRLMISNADAEGASEAALPGRRPRSALAQRLRFLYVGQRARAESVVQQRQPQLVEKLVASQIMSARYDADFSRTLFELLVPHDFKDTARQMQQMVLVLDEATANLPWELMLADEQPLAVRTAMVRQLASPRFRLRVNQTMENRAYVVGNPSTQGFFTAFPDGQPHGDDALDDLPAAEKEAIAVTDALARHGFDVERALGSQQRATDVVNRLYRHPYRLVHIAGHGMFDERAGEDRPRSGVVLSDGLLISAAEIDAMEVVPDLVFLNCCHLGRIEREPVAFNKLAATVSRQLIDIGVRAVVVAGWAVEDAAASLFAETFYEALLAGNLSFGEAVFRARCATWHSYPDSITWGAYQAYGDPGWRIDPKNEGTPTPRDGDTVGVAPEELLDRIQLERQAVQRSGEIISRAEALRIADKVRHWFDAMPPAWQRRPDLLSAAAELYTDLGPGFYERSRELYLQAILAADREGRVPIRAIERLGNVESRLGEDQDDAGMVAQGIARLTQLVQLTGGSLPHEDIAAAAGVVNGERLALMGSAWKRKAGVHARAYLRGGKAAEFNLMRDALAHGTACYAAMASKLDDKTIRPYQTLNWLFLWSLTAKARERLAYLSQAQRCAAAANVAYTDDPDGYNASMVADAALVGALLDDSLAAAAAGNDAALQGLVAGYQDALRTAMVTPKERDTVVKQIRFMALFHRAYEKRRGLKGRAGVGARLELLADRLS